MHTFITLMIAGLASTVIAAPSCDTGITPARKAKAISSFKKAKIIPGVVSDAWNPVLDVKPSYGSKAVNFGTVFSVPETLTVPTYNFNAEPDHDPATTNYTTLLVDPDVPNPNLNPLGYFLHLGRFDVKPSCIPKADQSPKIYRGYEALTPTSLAEHRYLFLVYRQPKGTFKPDFQLARAGGFTFDLQKFVGEQGLQLVGGNFLREGALS